jgi:hypothetical protein
VASVAMRRVPVAVSEDCSAGTSITDALAVVNRSDTPFTPKVYASEAFTTSSGAIDLLPANKKPVDVGSWITVKTRPSL